MWRREIHIQFNIGKKVPLSAILVLITATALAGWLAKGLEERKKSRGEFRKRKMCANSETGKSETSNTGYFFNNLNQVEFYLEVEYLCS